MPGFKATARTLDLLGRQQIANAPSAINELFKNAYDAYATAVEADIIRPENLLVIRDNGYGMTRKDFEEKWLVLGTSDKFSTSGRVPYKPLGMAPRPVAGEKGIGRLAVGILGPQAFVLTRARRAEGLYDAVASFINWSAFAIPDISLTEIHVPVRTLSSDQHPDRMLVKELVSEFRDRLLDVCQGRQTEGLEKLVIEELEQFNVDPETWIQELSGPDFISWDSGTQFYIQPVSNIVLDSVETDDDKRIPELARNVLGFTDSMTKDSGEVPIKLALRVHTGPGTFEDLIEESEFWTKEDFSKADHEIHGTFDEFGHFDGQVRIFKSEPRRHRIPNTSSLGKKTECGPFRFSLGYIQGVQSESSLSPTEYAAYGARLNEIAGVYVYRDGLRVLPYGDQEHDWLRIEERRTKGASYYFFSYRRMFGCVNISRSQNAQLRDKAGREGFQQTRAYSELRGLVQGTLIQLAADFFRDRDDATFFNLGRKENKKKNKAWEKHQVTKAQKIKQFRKQVTEIRELVSDDSLAAIVKKELAGMSQELAELKQSFGREISPGMLLDVESKYTDKLKKISSSLQVSRPRGMALSTQVERAYFEMSAKSEIVLRDVVEPAQLELERMILEAAKEAKTDLDQHLRVMTLLTKEGETYRRNVRSEASSTRKVTESIYNRIALLTHELTTNFEQELRVILAEASSLRSESLSQSSSQSLLLTCRQKTAQRAEVFLTGLTQLRQLMEGLYVEWDENSGLLSSLDISETMDAELDELRESAIQDLELAQVGLAVDIVNHEFLSSVNAVRKGLKSLESWAVYNPDLRDLHGVLDANFNHLENFLQLFTPLRRRFNAERTEITGRGIKNYLESIFFEKIKSMEVSVEFSNAFIERRVMSYASVFLPAFVNLMDNSLFWLADQPLPRRIELDATREAWFFSDNGPGIVKEYRDLVFKAGHTSKPGGRGLGLYISREVLRKNAFDLSIEPEPRMGQGVTFAIRPMQDGEM